MNEQEASVPVAKLACPICASVFCGKIFQCKNSHVVCENCIMNGKVKTCPSCRDVMTEEGVNLFRNIAMEDLMDAAKVNCLFQSNGCEEMVKIKELKDHLKDCVGNTHKINICKVLGFPCEIEVNPFNPFETRAHFFNLHGIPQVDGKAISVALVDDLLQLNANSPNDGKWLPFLWTYQTKAIIVAVFYKKTKDYISVALISTDVEIHDPRGVTGMASLFISKDVGQDLAPMEATAKIHSMLDIENAVKSPEIRFDPALLHDYRTETGSVNLIFTILDAEETPGTPPVRLQLPAIEDASLLDSEDEEEVD